MLTLVSYLCSLLSLQKAKIEANESQKTAVNTRGFLLPVRVLFFAFQLCMSTGSHAHHQRLMSLLTIDRSKHVSSGTSLFLHQLARCC